MSSNGSSDEYYMTSPSDQIYLRVLALIFALVTCDILTKFTLSRPFMPRPVRGFRLFFKVLPRCVSVCHKSVGLVSRNKTELR